MWVRFPMNFPIVRICFETKAIELSALLQPTDPGFTHLLFNSNRQGAQSAIAVGHNSQPDLHRIGLYRDFREIEIA